MLVQKRKLSKVSVGFMFFFISMNERKEWKPLFFPFSTLHTPLPVDSNRSPGTVCRRRQMLLFSWNVPSWKIVISIFLKQSKELNKMSSFGPVSSEGRAGEGETFI